MTSNHPTRRPKVYSTDAQDDVVPRCQQRHNCKEHVLKTAIKVHVFCIYIAPASIQINRRTSAIRLSTKQREHVCSRRKEIARAIC